MNWLLIPAGVLALMVAGCSIPKTPTEFRERAKTDTSYAGGTFEVRRSFAEVVKVVQAKAGECLNFKLVTVSKPLIGIGKKVDEWGAGRSTVLVEKDRAELHFQIGEPDPKADRMGTVPPGGPYYFVADIFPKGKGSTRVEYYGDKVAAAALKGWTSGENLGCPDPSVWTF